LTKQQLLLVDGDPRTLHVLEASLRSAGFAVMTAGNAQAALARCRVSPPDLVVSDTAIPGMDGFQLCQAIKGDEILKDTPVVFLSGHGSVEEKVRGLELGAEDYLTKPIDTREFVTRMRVLIDKKEKERRRGRDQRASFSGSLTDLSIADLLQTLEIGRKTGTVHIETSDGRTATLWLREGAVIDAVAGRRRGEAAFYWFLKWRDGRFSIQFGPVDRPARIESPTQHLLMEGMRRLDEWSHALERLPPAGSVLQLDYLLLSDRLAELPDEVNAVLKLVDGRRTVAQILEETDHDELEALSSLETLVREEIARIRTTRDEPPPLPRRPRSVVAAKRPSNRSDGEPSLATALAAAARAVPRADDPPTPRIVRFSLAPKMAVVIPPVASTRRRKGPIRPDTPAVAGDSIPVELVPAGRRGEPTRRAGGKGAFLMLVLALAAGFGAWYLFGRPQATPLRARALPVARGAEPYEVALAEARREQAAARFGEAVTAYRRALAERATSEGYEGLGRALRDTGDAPAAVQALLRAIELDPGNSAAYIAVARIHAEARRVDDARSAYQRYLALEPQGTYAEEARAVLGLSR
jgi:DNA-binding response OmpR family regulator